MGYVDLNTVRDLVLDSADAFKDAVEIADADVVEQPLADGTSVLLIRLRADTQLAHRPWTETRLRMSQKIRDELVRIGDLRYPVLSVYTEHDWQDRDQ